MSILVSKWDNVESAKTVQLCVYLIYLCLVFCMLFASATLTFSSTTVTIYFDTHFNLADTILDITPTLLLSLYFHWSSVDIYHNKEATLWGSYYATLSDWVIVYYTNIECMFLDYIREQLISRRWTFECLLQMFVEVHWLTFQYIDGNIIKVIPTRYFVTLAIRMWQIKVSMFLKDIICYGHNVSKTNLRRF